MKNKTNFSTQRREGAKTQNDVTPPRETPLSPLNHDPALDPDPSTLHESKSKGRDDMPAATTKRLSEAQITRKRHALFENFADFAIGHLDEDPALACKAAETALKALSAGEHDHPGASPTPGDDALKTPALSKFNEDLERAYAAE